MINRLLISVWTLLFLVGNVNGQYCTNDTRYTEVPFFDSSEISSGVNVQFGTSIDHLGNPYTLRLDLYYPNLAVDPSPKRPFIMLFHGGGFTSGDKQSGDIKDLCIHLARRGFVCATVNYRLGYNFTEYGQYKARYRAIQDGHAAMRYIVNNANSVRIDTSWLFVGGQSAGSLLALGMVYADQSELDSVSLLYNATAASVELGNLNTSGNNLINSYSIKGVFNNWGAVNANEMDINEMIPTVAFHGKFDTIVRIGADNSFLHYTLNGSETIHNILIAKNICSEITIDSTNEHGIYRNASSVFRASRASCFFKSVFCKSCSSFYSTDSIPSNCSSPVNIHEFNLSGKIEVYPNPFESTFKIDGIEGSPNLAIYDCMGKLVYREEKSDGNIQVNLNPGLYFLTIMQPESKKSITKKLIRN